MLKDLLSLPVTAGRYRIERDLEPTHTMTTIKPAGSALLNDQAKPAERQGDGASRRSADSQDAVRFRREDTSLHRLYESTRETVETSRPERLEQLRRAVKNGTYRPNLITVAERMLSL